MTFIQNLLHRRCFFRHQYSGLLKSSFFDQNRGPIFQIRFIHSYSIFKRLLANNFEMTLLRETGNDKAQF